MRVFKGFKNFLMHGDVVVVAVGLVVALAFSTLIKAFTDNVITPLVNAAAGNSKTSTGLSVTINHQQIAFGAVVSAIVYFVVFMTTVYFAIVVPYRVLMQRRGQTVFGDPAPTKTCPACLSSDLPVAATKCKYCVTDQPATA